MPLLRGFLFMLVILAALAAVGFLAFKVVELLLRRAGVDLRELKAYNERMRRYFDQLRQLEEQMQGLDVNSREFENAAMTLKSFEETRPQPPRWARWLK